MNRKQNQMKESLQLISGDMNQSLKTTSSGGGSWRRSVALFKEPADCIDLPSGELTLSPALFQQGHDVCRLPHFVTIAPFHGVP
jgi:hypothetical protein